MVQYQHSMSFVTISYLPLASYVYFIIINQYHLRNVIEEENEQLNRLYVVGNLWMSRHLALFLSLPLRLPKEVFTIYNPSGFLGDVVLQKVSRLQSLVGGFLYKTKQSKEGLVRIHTLTLSTNLEKRVSFTLLVILLSDCYTFYFNKKVYVFKVYLDSRFTFLFDVL